MAGKISTANVTLGRGMNVMSTIATTKPEVTAKRGTSFSLRGWLQDALPKIVLAPSFAITLVFVYGFILWTVYLSFTNSKTFPSTTLTGALAYEPLWLSTFQVWPP